MKKLIVVLCPIILMIGCSKKSDPFNFLGCQLATIDATGSDTWSVTFIYNSTGNKAQYNWTKSGSANYSEVYAYDANKIIKVTTTYETQDLTYTSGKLTKIVYKDLGGNLTATEDVTYNNNVVTYTKKNPSSVVTQTNEFTLSGQDVTKQIYKAYNGTTLTFEEDLVFSNFDSYYNPEYLSEAVIYPASLHNYNLVAVTDTNNSGVSPVITNYNLTYIVTPNQSKAVAYRKRTKSDDGAILTRTYTYNKCQ